MKNGKGLLRIWLKKIIVYLMGTLNLRIQHADTIIFIHLPRMLRLYRVGKAKIYERQRTSRYKQTL